MPPSDEALAQVNLLDLAGTDRGEGAPHALNRRLPAMVAELLRAAGLSARHGSTTIPLPGEARPGWALAAGLLDDGEAIQLSRRLGPAELLVHGELGPSGPAGMGLTLRVLRRRDGELVLEVERDFYAEEVDDVVTAVARELASLVGRSAEVGDVSVADVLGTADGTALLRLQEGLDGLAALEGGVAGADAERTARLFVSALEADPSCDPAAARAVAVLAQRVEDRRALPLARDLADRRPADESAVLLLARLLQREGLVEAARDRLAAFEGTSRRIAAELVQVSLALGLLESALETAQLALDQEATAEEGRLLELRGIALARMERLDDARESLAAAVAAEPARGEAWANLARCLHLLSRHDEAWEAYEKALELAPGSWEAARNFAELAAETGELERASSLVEQWVEAHPDDVGAWLARSELQLALGQLAAARSRLEEATGRWPDDERLHAQLGGILLSMGEPAGAESHYRRALELSPDDPALLSNVAVVLADRGQLAEAERLASRAVALAPNDIVSLRVLEHIRQKN